MSSRKTPAAAEFDMAAFMSGVTSPLEAPQPLLAISGTAQSATASGGGAAAGAAAPSVAAAASASAADDMNRSTSSMSSISRMFPKEDFKDDPDLEFLSKGTKKTLASALYVAERRTAGGQLLWSHFYAVLENKLEELVDSEGSFYDPSIVPRDKDPDAACSVKECMQSVAQVLIKESKIRQLGAEGRHHRDPDEGADDPPIVVEKNIFGRSHVVDSDLVAEQTHQRQPIAHKQVMLEDGSLHMQPQRVVVLSTLDYFAHKLAIVPLPAIEVLDADEGDCCAGEEIALHYRWGDVVVSPMWRFAFIVILICVATIIALSATLSHNFGAIVITESELRATTATGVTTATIDVLRDAFIEQFKEFAGTVAQRIAAVFDQVTWDLTTAVVENIEDFSSTTLLNSASERASVAAATTIIGIHESVTLISRLGGDATPTTVLAAAIDSLNSAYASSTTPGRIKVAWAWVGGRNGVGAVTMLSNTSVVLENVRRGSPRIAASLLLCRDQSNPQVLLASCMTQISGCFSQLSTASTNGTTCAVTNVSSFGGRWVASCMASVAAVSSHREAAVVNICEEDLADIVGDVFLPMALGSLLPADGSGTPFTSLCTTHTVASRSSDGGVMLDPSPTATASNDVATELQLRLVQLLTGPSNTVGVTSRSFTLTAANSSVVEARLIHQGINFGSVARALGLPPQHPLSRRLTQSAGTRARFGLLRLCDMTAERDQRMTKLVDQWGAVYFDELIGNKTSSQMRFFDVTTIAVGQLHNNNETLRVVHGGETHVVPATRLPHLLQAAFGRTGTIESVSLQGQRVIAGFASATYARRAVAVEVPFSMIDSQTASSMCSWLHEQELHVGSKTAAVRLASDATYRRLCSVLDSNGINEGTAEYDAAIVSLSADMRLLFLTASSGVLRVVRSAFVPWLGASVAVSFAAHHGHDELAEVRATLTWVSVLVLCALVVGLVMLAKYTLRDIDKQYRLYKHEIDAEKDSFIELLREKVPTHLFRRVELGERLFLDYAERLSFGLIDICNMTDVWINNDPFQVVRMLAYVFHVEDGVATYYGLFKLRHIGDAYLCVGGMPETTVPRGSTWADADETHMFRMLSFTCVLQQLMSGFYEHSPEASYSFRAFSEQHRLPTKDAVHLPLLRIGVHFGPAKVGVVDVAETPSFDCYGPSLALVKGMESTAPPGRIQLSSAARAAMRDQDPRHLIEFTPAAKKLIVGFGTVPVYMVQSSKVAVPEELVEWLGCTPTVRHRMHGADGLRDVSSREVAASLRADGSAALRNDASSSDSAAAPSMHSESHNSESVSETGGGIKPFTRR